MHTFSTEVTSNTSPASSQVHTQRTEFHKVMASLLYFKEY